MLIVGNNIIIKKIKSFFAKRKIKNKNYWYIGIFVLLFLIIIFIGLYKVQVNKFYNEIFTSTYKQELSFSYYLNSAFNNRYTFVIGDLNGLNKEGKQKVNELLRKKYYENKGYIFIPSLMLIMQDEKELNVEQFLNLVSNNNGIVPVDNFCTANWENIKRKDIYKNSSLSPGIICNSETQVKDLIQLIHKFNVQKIIMLYDVAEYRDFVNNFVNYLDEQNIIYEFVQNKKEKII